MIALIDGDMAVYMASAGTELKIDMGDGLGETPFVDPDKAIATTFGLIDEWTRKAGAERAVVCLSEGDSFRKLLLPTYKGNRSPDKPLAYWEAIKAVKQEYEVCIEPGLEADDLMGIGSGEGYVIVSGDKDMLTVPALVFNPRHDDKPRKITPRIADMMHLKQTMTGDIIDNYTGIPGVGEVKAQDILNNPHRLGSVSRVIRKGKLAGQTATKWHKGEPCSIWQSMVAYAAKAGMDEAALIRMAQVSRILRSGDWTPETKTIRLWRPDGKTQELQL